MSTNPLGHPEETEEIATTEPAKVILFNDEVHTFDEVITQLIKATGCSQSKAEALAFEVHNNGKAVVFSGEMRSGDPVGYVADISRARLLGWQPVTGWKEGLSDFVAWFKEGTT